MIGKYAANTFPLEQSWQELEGSICEISSRSDSSFLFSNQGKLFKPKLVSERGGGEPIKSPHYKFKYWLLPRGGEQCSKVAM